MLDFERVQAQLLLAGRPGAGARCCTSSPIRRRADDEGIYTCDGPAQFLVDTCLGRDPVNRAPVDLGVRTVAVMEAAWQSAHSGRLVRVADLPR